jgi:hypothetical protein
MEFKEKMERERKEVEKKRQEEMEEFKKLT